MPEGRQSTRQPCIFISHSHVDKKRFVQRLALDLRDAGAEVFYDDWSIKPGERLRNRISAGIKHCDYFVVVLSVRSVRSAWVKRELDEAMLLEIQGYGPCVVPVVIGRLDHTSIPTDLLGLLWVDFRPGGEKRYRKGLITLLEATGLAERRELPMTGSGCVMSEAEIRKVLGWFVERGDAGTFDEDEFWEFWDEKRSKMNCLRVLAVMAELLGEGKEKHADLAMQTAHAIASRYDIQHKVCPRVLRTLLSSEGLSDAHHATIMQLILALQARLPKTLLLNHLDFARREKLYATCEYIEYAGVIVDAEITDRLLQIVESDDEDRFYFIGHDRDGIETEVDAREQAARCLMLSDRDPDERSEVTRRVKARFPEVVDSAFDITLNAMLLGAIHDQPRQSFPLAIDTDDE